MSPWVWDPRTSFLMQTLHPGPSLPPHLYWQDIDLGRRSLVRPQIQAMTCWMDGQQDPFLAPGETPTARVSLLLPNVRIQHRPHGRPKGCQVPSPGLSAQICQRRLMGKEGRRMVVLSQAQPTTPSAFLLCFLWLTLTNLSRGGDWSHFCLQ